MTVSLMHLKMAKSAAVFILAMAILAAGVHSQNTEGCKTTTAQGCTECLPSYYLSSTACLKCLSMCSTCSNGSTCDSCRDDTNGRGRYPDRDQCLSCSENCDDCTSAKLCTKCIAGFSLERDNDRTYCESSESKKSDWVIWLFVVIIAVCIIACIAIGVYFYNKGASKDEVPHYGNPGYMDKPALTDPNAKPYGAPTTQYGGGYGTTTGYTQLQQSPQPTYTNTGYGATANLGYPNAQAQYMGSVANNSNQVFRSPNTYSALQSSLANTRPLGQMQQNNPYANVQPRY